MSSEPEYFYTVELPERYGRMIEAMSAETDGLIDPERMAAHIICDALRTSEALKGNENLRRLVAEEVARAAGIEVKPDAGAGSPPFKLDEDIPF